MACNHQIYLDPSVEGASGSWKPPGPIPQKLRRFGRFPNTSLWKPGDLLLFSAVRPSLASRAIVRTQTNGGFAEQDARWHHAAVYVGHNHICEAVLSGVRYGPIYPYVGAHLIRVRRDETLTEMNRYELAIRSLAHLREDYSVKLLPLLAFYGLAGFWNRKTLPPDTPTVICSQVFAHAYTGTTMRLVAGPQAIPVVPADLSMTDTLTDVKTDWLSF